MTNITKHVQKWLSSGKNYDKGISLLLKYSKQKILIATLSKNENPQKKDKLLYELTKLAGITHEYNKKSTLIKEEKKKLKTTKKKGATERTIKITEKIIEKLEETKEDNFKTVTKTTTFKAGKGDKSKTLPFNKLPLIIQEVMKQKGNLYRDREVLYKKLQSIPQNNKSVNVGARVVIAEKISHISERIDVLYQAQKYFEEHNGVPDESILNWDPVPLAGKPKVIDHSKLSDIELKNRQANVRSNITKTKNIIAYQKPSKQEKANPMPEGPKRKKYEAKLTLLTNELAEIDKAIEKIK